MNTKVQRNAKILLEKKIQSLKGQIRRLSQELEREKDRLKHGHY